MTTAKIIKAKCDNCGMNFSASFEKIDNTGIVTISNTGSGAIVRALNFCNYDCEKAFVAKTEKKFPEIAGSWVPATQDQITKYPKYYSERSCALCGSKANLQLSHIVPRFVIKWLKETSTTGFVRSVASGERIQDSYKLNLLCGKCEELFSVWEKYFAEQIFFPYQNDSTLFSYDEKLNKFATSLAWRIVRLNLYELADDPVKTELTEKALETWSD